MMRLVSIRRRFDHVEEIAQDLQARVARLLRVELHAEDVVAARPTDANVFGVRRGGRAGAGDRRRERVREVDLRARGRGRRAARAGLRKSSAFQPTCGIFRRRSASPSRRWICPGSTPEAAARRAPRRCPRTATACRRRCRGAACRAPRPRQSCRATGASSTAVAAKWPTPGTIEAGRVRARRRHRAASRTPRRASSSALRTDVRLPAP